MFKRCRRIAFEILEMLCIVQMYPSGIPVRTTMDNSTTVQYANLLHSLTAQARNCVRDVDPTNDLTFLRVRSKKNEVMVAPGVLLKLLFYISLASLSRGFRGCEFLYHIEIKISH